MGCNSSNIINPGSESVVYLNFNSNTTSKVTAIEEYIKLFKMRLTARSFDFVYVDLPDDSFAIDFYIFRDNCYHEHRLFLNICKQNNKICLSGGIDLDKPTYIHTPDAFPDFKR